MTAPWFTGGFAPRLRFLHSAPSLWVGRHISTNSFLLEVKLFQRSIYQPLLWDHVSWWWTPPRNCTAVWSSPWQLFLPCSSRDFSTTLLLLCHLSFPTVPNPSNPLAPVSIIEAAPWEIWADRIPCAVSTSLLVFLPLFDNWAPFSGLSLWSGFSSSSFYSIAPVQSHFNRLLPIPYV